MVTIGLPNSPEWFVACLATWKLGAVPNLVSPRLPLPEREAIIDRADPALVVGGSVRRGRGPDGGPHRVRARTGPGRRAPPRPHLPGRAGPGFGGEHRAAQADLQRRAGDLRPRIPAGDAHGPAGDPRDRPDLPRDPLRHRLAHRPGRGHGGGAGPVRPGRVPPPDRAPPGRQDEPRPHDDAAHRPPARRGAPGPGRLQPRVRADLGLALPAVADAALDRLARARRDARDLRLHRAHRGHPHHRSGVAGASRFGGTARRRLPPAHPRPRDPRGRPDGRAGRGLHDAADRPGHVLPLHRGRVAADRRRLGERGRHGPRRRGRLPLPR